MKKLISVFALCALFCSGIFAQSDEYTTLLKKAKDYEEKKMYASALGTYWDAIAAEPSEKSKEAIEAFQKIEGVIRSGKPGFGEYDEFSIYDEWVLLAKDFERYFTENPPVTFEVRGIQKGDIDRATKTATYKADVVISFESVKEEKIQDIVLSGLEKVRRSDWDALVKWPRKSVVADDAKKDGNFLRDGIALFVPYGEYEDYEYYAVLSFMYSSGYNHDLYDIEVSIVDENGEILASTKEYEKQCEIVGDFYIFRGIDQTTMKIIDSGKAKVKLSSVSLWYGDPETSYWDRAPLSSFPKVKALKIDTKKILAAENDIDVIKFVKQQKAEAERKEREAKEAAEAEKLAAEQAAKKAAEEEIKAKTYTYTGDKKVATITIPDGYEIISENCFKDCKKLKTVVIPSSIKLIGENAFKDCKDLKHINYRGTLEYFMSNVSPEDMLTYRQIWPIYSEEFTGRTIKNKKIKWTYNYTGN